MVKQSQRGMSALLLVVGLSVLMFVFQTSLYMMERQSLSRFVNARRSFEASYVAESVANIHFAMNRSSAANSQTVVTFPSDFSKSIGQFTATAQVRLPTAGETAGATFCGSVSFTHKGQTLRSCYRLANSCNAQGLTEGFVPVANGLVLNLDAQYAATGGTEPQASGCGSLSWHDSSGNGNHATLYNFTSCGSHQGWLGTGTSTDPYRLAMSGYPTNGGSRAYALSPLNIRNFPQMTMMVFFRPRPSSVNNPYLIGNDGYYSRSIMFNSSATSLFYMNGNNASTPAIGPLTANNWAHGAVAFTTASGGTRAYLNGTLGHSLSSGSPISGNSYFLIGRSSYGGGVSYLTGDIAVIQVYNRMLSQAEISQNCVAYQCRFSGLVCN